MEYERLDIKIEEECTGLFHCVTFNYFSVSFSHGVLISYNPFIGGI